MLRSLTLCALLFVSACASIAQGESQDIRVKTVPDGAKCTIVREGETIAVIAPTPGEAEIERNAHDIDILCTKDGYREAKLTRISETNVAFWYNFYWLLPLITAPITLVGVIVDLSTGAYHDYDSPVTVTMDTEGA